MPLFAYNGDCQNIVTAVAVDRLQKMLIESEYSKDETEFLVNGFQNGFNIGYEGTPNHQSMSENILFTVGDKTELLNKPIKEVQLG